VVERTACRFPGVFGAVEVEVPRALRRHAPEALGAVTDVLARLYRLEIDATIRSIAGGYVDGLLRSLDAIHLVQCLGFSW